MNREKNKPQRGQALVLVALAMIAMMAMLALVLDGGNTFMNRRAMQNAADAGALAGVRQLCLTRSETDAEFVAHQYATVWNTAQAADEKADLETRTVVVTATRQVSTFFAHFIGLNNIKAQAVAEAGCFNAILADGVLPVAWICRASINPSTPEPGEDPEPEFDCEGDYINEDDLDDLKNFNYSSGDIPSQLYIIMDDVSVPNDLDAVCISQGGNLQCDLDGDNEDDLLSMGGRSWLDLSGGGGGANELVDWINGNNVPPIGWHYWLTGQSGTANSVFQAVGDNVGKTVIIPVFDEICDSDDVVNDCTWHVPPDVQDTDQTGAGGGINFHIVSFSLFYISCVNAPGVSGPECPGHKYARETGVFSAIQGVNAQNPKTIEGFIYTGSVEELKGDPSNPGNIDTGAYVFYLTR